jgi:hypothetical protein
MWAIYIFVFFLYTTRSDMIYCCYSYVSIPYHNYPLKGWASWVGPVQLEDDFDYYLWWYLRASQLL